MQAFLIGVALGVLVLVVGFIARLSLGEQEYAGQRKAERMRAMTCPHCQTKGSVAVKRVRIKGGVSGGKATGALLTGGLSLLATGLSRKHEVTEASCSECGAVWHFE
jgi:hypothetical protein